MTEEDLDKKYYSLSLSHRINFTAICDKYSSLESGEKYNHRRLDELATKYQTSNKLNFGKKVNNCNGLTHNREAALSDLDVVNYLNIVDQQIDNRIRNYTFDSTKESIPVDSLQCENSFLRDVNKENMPVAVENNGRHMKRNRRIYKLDKNNRNKINVPLNTSQSDRIQTRSVVKALKEYARQTEECVVKLTEAKSLTNKPKKNKKSSKNINDNYPDSDESDLITILPSYKHDEGSTQYLTEKLNGYLTLDEDLTVRFVDNLSSLDDVCLLYVKKDYISQNETASYNLKEQDKKINVSFKSTQTVDKCDSIVKESIPKSSELALLPRIILHNILDCNSPIKVQNRKRPLQHTEALLENSFPAVSKYDKSLRSSPKMDCNTLGNINPVQSNSNDSTCNVSVSNSYRKRPLHHADTWLENNFHAVSKDDKSLRSNPKMDCNTLANINPVQSNSNDSKCNVSVNNSYRKRNILQNKLTTFNIRSPIGCLNVCNTGSSLMKKQKYLHDSSALCILCSKLCVNIRMCKYSKSVANGHGQSKDIRDSKDKSHLSPIKWNNEKGSNLGSLRKIRSMKHEYSMITSTYFYKEYSNNVEQETFLKEENNTHILMGKCNLPERKNVTEHSTIFQKLEFHKPRKNIMCTKLMGVLNQSSFNRSMLPSRRSKEFAKNISLLFNK